jgi:peptidoglycan-associated lipoprotein
MGSLTASLIPVLMVVMLVVAGAGCAKRPDITVTAAAAPAPTGPAPAAPPAPEPTPAPPAVQPAAPAPPAAEPAPPVARPTPREFALNDALRPIHFDFDKADIRPGDAQILERNAQWLIEHRDHLLLVEGHCDSRGTSEYNLALGERRARATKNFLVSRGVPDSRVAIISYGKERPVCQEATEACWARDRRAMSLTKPQ